MYPQQETWGSLMRVFASFAVGAALLLTASAGVAQQAPFGGGDDVAFARSLWTAMADARMVGANSLAATTYQGGTGLHTETLISLQGRVTVNGNDGFAIVKKNFVAGDQAATEEQVFADPDKYLRVLTVMYQRERGFDSDNQDWFWVVYTPDGNVRVNPLGMNMAGRIVGGGAMPDAPFNCVACHQGAPGNDYVFLHDSVPAR